MLRSILKISDKKLLGTCHRLYNYNDAKRWKSREDEYIYIRTNSIFKNKNIDATGFRWIDYP